MFMIPFKCAFTALIIFVLTFYIKFDLGIVKSLLILNTPETSNNEKSETVNSSPFAKNALKKNFTLINITDLYFPINNDICNTGHLSMVVTVHSATQTIFYGIWMKQSVAMVFIFNLDKVSLKKLFPTMNI